MRRIGASLAQPSRSTFVTVVAWIFIVLAALASLVAIVQALMVMFMLPAGVLPPAAGAYGALQDLPAALRLLLRNVWLVFVAFWLIAIMTLVAAIGVLLRKNWARLMFVGLLGIGIAWNVGAIWLQRAIISSMHQPPTRAPAEIASDLETMAKVMGIGMTLFAVGISLVLAWIAIRLMSPAISAEFKRE